jgi:hypothetical protein
MAKLSLSPKPIDKGATTRGTGDGLASGLGACGTAIDGRCEAGSAENAAPGSTRTHSAVANRPDSMAPPALKV